MVRSKIIIGGLFCGLFAVSHVQAADDTPALGVYPVYATNTLKSNIENAKIDTQELARQIEESVRATRRFRLIERDKQVMQNSLFVEQGMVAAKGGGPMNEANFPADIDYLIQPIIVSFTLSIRKSPQEEDPNKFRYSCSGAAAVTIKLLVPGKGEKSGEIKYQTTRETALKSTANVCKNITTNDDTAAMVETWRAMSKDLSLKITNAAVGYIFPILVMQVRGDDIFINRGEGAGINLNEEYQLFSVGEELIDPETKESLGSEEIYLGPVKIVRINPKFSIARVPEGKTLKDKPKREDVLRDSVSGLEK